MAPRVRHLGMPTSGGSAKNPWSWPPNWCGSPYDPLEDWVFAVEAIETDPDNY